MRIIQQPKRITVKDTRLVFDHPKGGGGYSFPCCPTGEVDTLRLSLMEFTNTCTCGRDYNSCGQLLADREQWGVETGEHWSECY